MILVKQHNSHQVAHFYEHLFCMTVDDFFYDEELFPYLDYDVTGRTIHGIVYIEIDLYTKKAKQLAKKIPNLEITIDDHILSVVFAQLGADLEQKLGLLKPLNYGQKVLAEELYVLHAKPWKNIDEIDVIDPRNTKLVVGALGIPKDIEKIPTKKVEISFALDQDFVNSHKDFLPLFANTARLISANVRTTLFGQFGYYATGISHTSKHHTNIVTQSFRAMETHKGSVKDVREMTEATLIELQKKNAFTRFMSQLSRVATDNPDSLLPDSYRTYKQTDMIIGAKGWQRLATNENCNLLLSHTEVVVTIREEKASIKIESLFKKSATLTKS